MQALSEMDRSSAKQKTENNLKQLLVAAQPMMDTMLVSRKQMPVKHIQAHKIRFAISNVSLSNGLFDCFLIVSWTDTIHSTMIAAFTEKCSNTTDFILN
jgi:hypothetical protein